MTSCIVGAPLAVLALGGLLLSKSVGAGIYTSIAGGVIGIVIAALAWPCGYTLTEDRLIIRSGMLWDELRMAGIRAVEKSSALWSAPRSPCAA